MLAEICEAVGLPAGVFNLVTGTGPVVGEAIVAHPQTSTWSASPAPRARAGACPSWRPRTVKPVSLELGGKSPNVILDDADLEQAVIDGVAKCFLNSGQTCSALTRMLVPREKLEQAERIAAAVADEAFTPGDPFADGSALGPLVSDAQRERVRGYIEKGQAEGAKLVTGGAEPPEGLDTGYFVRPTVFSEVTPEMTIAQEEIFGPVLAIMPYDDEEDAVRIANDSIYGLAGGVWSGDEERAKPSGTPASARARSRSTAAPSTRWPRSAATSSPATGASWGATGSRSSSWRSRCSCKRSASSSSERAPAALGRERTDPQ